MNTVLSFNDLHFTHRGDEFRIVSKELDESIFISILSLKEINDLKKNNSSIVTIMNSVHTTVNNAYAVEYTTFDRENRMVILKSNVLTRKYTLEKEEWENFYSYMLNGQEGNVYTQVSH